MSGEVGDSWREVYGNMCVSTNVHDSSECPKCGYKTVAVVLGEPTCERCQWSRTRDRNNEYDDTTKEVRQ